MCGNVDQVVKVNPYVHDYSHPVYFQTGNQYIDSGINLNNRNTNARLTKMRRPRLSTVNIADCVDMHCDGHKKVAFLT